MDEHSPVVPPKQSLKKRPPFFLFWWKINGEELLKQINEYDTLKFHQSAYGISVILLLLSALITGIMVIYTKEYFGLIDVFAILIFAILIYLKFRWAMIAAMIFWTFEKLVSLFDGGNIVVILLWWALFMHYFYLAYKVESLYKEIQKDGIKPPSQPSAPVASAPNPHMPPQ